MLEVLLTIVSKTQNSDLKRVLTMEEVKVEVMGLNRNGAGGPDGMANAFYQDAWNIISNDLQ